MTGTPHADETPAELAGRLRLVASRLHRRVRLASSVLPPLQLSTLATLARHGPLRPSDLAQREAVSAPVMTRVLAALDEAPPYARVLVKGSRFMKMEQVVAALQAGEAGGSDAA